MGYIGDTKNKSKQKNYRFETENSKEAFRALGQLKKCETIVFVLEWWFGDIKHTAVVLINCS